MSREIKLEIWPRLGGKNKVLQTNYTIYQQLHNYSDGAVRDLFNIETKINVKEL